MERLIVVIVMLVLGYAAIAGGILLGAILLDRYQNRGTVSLHPCGDPGCTENHGEPEP